MTRERLQKVLSRAGVSSRRKAEELILAGRVSVNGKTAVELGTRADLEVDSVRVDGRRIRPGGPVRVLALHKPREVVTSLNDPEGRPTVRDLIPGRHGRLYPVGRLDYHSEGLLLLTNDGDLAHAIQRAGSGIAKIYEVKVKGRPAASSLRRFARGMVIEGRPTRPSRVAALRSTKEAGNTWLEVTLHEGRRNQIRLMFQRLGHPVQKLKRVRVGPIALAPLRPGGHRELQADEIDALRQAVGMPCTRRPRRSGQEPRFGERGPKRRKA